MNHTKDLGNLVPTKMGSSYQTSPVSKKALDTGQKNNDPFKVMQSSDYELEPTAMDDKKSKSTWR